MKISILLPFIMILVMGIGIFLYPIPAQGESNNLTKTSIIEFIDKDNEFSMQIPSDWQVKPKESRFDSTDVSLTSADGPIGGFITIEYSLVGQEFKQTLKDSNINIKKIQKNLDDLFPYVLQGFSKGFDRYQEVEEPQYDKYTINGNKAASIIYAFTLSERDLAGLYIFTIINEKKFNMNFAADRSEFDNVLPIVEDMIKSIKILN